MNQVDKTHYNFKKYCPIDRWSSYWYQINEILKLQPESVLEVGVGDRVLSNYLASNTEIKYLSADIAGDLRPDVVCGVENLEFTDNSFDVACAFEVLEHLPFDKFNRALSELKRVSSGYVIISIPHWGRHFSINIRLPLLGKIKWQHKFSFLPVPHKFNGQHYWEMGKRGYSYLKIREVIKSSGLEIIDDYIPIEMPYHHFFILSK